MVFPSARGLLVERGSLLSHAAIVARELGIPAVVSLPGRHALAARTATGWRWTAAPASFGAFHRRNGAMRSEAAARADFSAIRYAQVWEDADVLLAGLDVQPGDVCVSIASAGDNALALLTKDPSRVIALDLSPAQLACLELRVAAYKTLTHPELLELVGSRPSTRRAELFDRCRPALGAATREFWDRQRTAIEHGIGSLGKFERYFALFRNRVLPLVHSRRTVLDLLEPRTPEERRRFYEERWDTWRWRLLFRMFFSRTVMGRLGRDPEFFRYVDIDVAASILDRTRHALSVLDPAENPYVHWILTGTHGAALPCALRAEHFETIRDRLDRLEWHCQSVEEFLERSRRAHARSIQSERPVRVRVRRALPLACSRRSSAAAVPARGSPTGTCSRRGGGPST